MFAVFSSLSFGIAFFIFYFIRVWFSHFCSFSNWEKQSVFRKVTQVLIKTSSLPSHSLMNAFGQYLQNGMQSSGCVNERNLHCSENENVYVLHNVNDFNLFLSLFPPDRALPTSLRSFKQVRVSCNTQSFFCGFIFHFHSLSFFLGFPDPFLVFYCGLPCFTFFKIACSERNVAICVEFQVQTWKMCAF